MIDDNQSDPYPTLTWLVRNGSKVPFATAVVVLVGAAALAYSCDSWALAVVGAAFSLVSYVGSRLVVELVTLLTDMLLPKP